MEENAFINTLYLSIRKLRILLTLSEYWQLHYLQNLNR